MVNTTQTAHSDAQHDAHAHPRFLAHHFESHTQQFETGKLGMWLFLVQEMLFFSGLFCAYAIYRSNHPEIFEFADHFLDRKLGLLNTCVLIFSSFTIAWAVRAVQMEQKKLAIALLLITNLCAFGFLGVKTIEYRSKFQEGLLWGKNFKPTQEALEHVEHAAQAEQEGGPLALLVQPGHAEKPKALSYDQEYNQHPKHPGARDASAFRKPANTHIFFGIYFAMTGLHALHIIIGILVIFWITYRTARGDFNKEYFAPVEYTGLYWHLVDLVWIYLFPLLYLIH